MKRAGSIALRSASLSDETSARPAKRNGLFELVVMALHRSRRRQARHLVRHYRHLITKDFQCRLAGAFLDFNNENESSRNANGDQTSVRTGYRKPHNV